MKILIIGYGKMGRMIDKMARERGDEISAVINHQEDWEHMQPSSFADVAIEFTQPEAVKGNLLMCFNLGIPVVCGTTGWYHHLPEIEATAKALDGSLLYAPNFSKGVNLLFALNRWLAEKMNQHAAYNVSIQEYHHIHKLDAPSGTAIKLADDLAACHSRYDGWERGAAAGPDKIPIKSVRNGEIPGAHSIIWESPYDKIQIIHEANSRHMLAEGALDAAHWLIGRKGIYTFEQMLFA